MGQGRGWFRARKGEASTAVVTAYILFPLPSSIPKFKSMQAYNFSCSILCNAGLFWGKGQMFHYKVCFTLTHLHYHAGSNAGIQLLVSKASGQPVLKKSNSLAYPSDSLCSVFMAVNSMHKTCVCLLTDLFF